MEKKELTAEELARKDKVKTRLFILLIVLDILLVAYLIFEMVSVIKI